MHRKNNFDFIRLVLASFVIVSHSYVLSGNKSGDWLFQITKGQLTFSDLGVKGFFIISGYLIFQSLERSKDILDYYWKRLLRLFPGLFVVLLLTVLLAPFVYEKSATPYLYNVSMWTYVPNNLSLFKTQYVIDGVFENNIFKKAVNGSLWTIHYEFTMYVLLSLLFFFRKKIKFIRTLLSFILAVFIIGNIFFIEQLETFRHVLNGGHFFDLGAFFIAGSFMASIQIENNKYFDIIAVISFTLLIAFLLLGWYDHIQFFTLPILIISFGLKSTPIISTIGDRIGDLSYGIYIYGFPIQQTLMHYFKLNYLELMLYSLIIAFILAYLSWHLIEEKALKLKKVNISIVVKNWANLHQ